MVKEVGCGSSIFEILIEIDRIYLGLFLFIFW